MEESSGVKQFMQCTGMLTCIYVFLSVKYEQQIFRRKTVNKALLESVKVIFYTKQMLPLKFNYFIHRKAILQRYIPNLGMLQPYRLLCI